MDRTLLERMIGATVLVILLVVLAPALLDGRQSPGSVTSDADTDVMRAPAQDAPLKVATIRLQEPAQAADEAAPAPKAEMPVLKPEPAAAKPVTAAPAVAESQKAPVVQPRPGEWMVQLGSFSAQKNADDYAKAVKKAGFPAVVSSFRSGSKTMYRVQVGPRESRESAEKLVSDLQKAGYKALVMPVTS